MLWESHNLLQLLQKKTLMIAIIAHHVGQYFHFHLGSGSKIIMTC